MPKMELAPSQHLALNRQTFEERKKTVFCIIYHHNLTPKKLEENHIKSNPKKCFVMIFKNVSNSIMIFAHYSVVMIAKRARIFKLGLPSFPHWSCCWYYYSYCCCINQIGQISKHKQHVTQFPMAALLAFFDKSVLGKTTVLDKAPLYVL